jgi:hypothetical protein
LVRKRAGPEDRVWTEKQSRELFLAPQGNLFKNSASFSGRAKKYPRCEKRSTPHEEYAEAGEQEFTGLFFGSFFGLFFRSAFPGV